MEVKKERRLVVGILAHVDAGKTTLAEGLLYESGNIRKIGRVDHGDSYLDNFQLERNRGITIFSKQAKILYKDLDITLLDTPGHVDFSAEMERTLQVLDYAILVVSASGGVQGHTRTVWKLLKKYNIPVFVFVNKMDQPGCEKEKVLELIKKELSERCISFDKEITTQYSEEFLENISMYDEVLMEEYLENGCINVENVKRAIAERNIFPCFFGAALKLDGVKGFLELLNIYMITPEYQEEFAARVFKIGRDENGNRLTYIKVTGGVLKVKSVFDNDEKIDQIRVYSGGNYTLLKEAVAGTVCALTGLTKTYTGQKIGSDDGFFEPVLEPVLNYRIVLPEDCNVAMAYRRIRELDEEDPMLSITWDETLQEINAKVMGEIQIEVLKHTIKERFGLEAEFGTGNIVYKETIEDRVEGVGHFEPLKHYAEVHLVLDPLEQGSGMVFESECSENDLDRNWQRLILTHLKEKKHVGVLTGSEITDMRIILAAGRAHLKHTEGGDFRQATYRAVRQGLMQAKSRLLEPFYEFRLELPTEAVGRALTDIQRMSGEFSPIESMGDITIIKGIAPVSEMNGYQSEVVSYTKGKGRLFCNLKGYYPCHNEEEIIAEKGYVAEADMDNPVGSIFCAHGAGYYVEWDKVKENMHLESVLKKDKKAGFDGEMTDKNVPEENNDTFGKFKSNNYSGVFSTNNKAGEAGSVSSNPWREDKELEEIFTRTYGGVKQKRDSFKKSGSGGYNGYKKKKSADSHLSGEFSSHDVFRKKKGKEEYLLVDGYNIIFSWEELNELSKVDIDAARRKLMDILSNYQGYKKINVILVYDAYKVEGNIGESFKYNNIDVIYTRESETADTYIERITHEIGKKYNVTVATGDAWEQRIIWGNGALRMSPMGLFEEIMSVSCEISEKYLNKSVEKNRISDILSDEAKKEIEKIESGEE